MNFVYISRIVIENVKGIDYRELEMRLHGLTVIRAKNGSGKSSICDAIVDFFEGGHTPTLIRHGAKKAKITVTFSNGDVIWKSVTKEGYKAEGKSADGTPLKAIQTYINSLAHSIAFNPAKFLGLTPKQQLDYLAGFLALDFQPHEVAAAVGSIAEDLLPKKPISISEFDETRKKLAARRKTAKDKAEEKTAHAEQLREDIRKNPAPDSDWQTELDARSKELSELTTAESSEVRENEIAAKEARTTVENSLRDQEDLLREEYQQKLQAARDASESRIKTLNRIESEAIRVVRDKYATRKTELSVAVERARNGIQNDAQRKTLLAVLNRADAERVAGWKTHADFDAAVKALDDARAEKLGKLPLEGMDVRDGELYCGQTRLADVNKADRLIIAMQVILTDTRGVLPFLLLDEAEVMVGKTWDDFREMCENANPPIQVLAMRAEDVKMQSDPQGALLVT